jgi:hypothetical protein
MISKSNSEQESGIRISLLWSEIQVWLVLAKDLGGEEKGSAAAYLRPHSTHPPVGNPFRCGRRHAASFNSHLTIHRYDSYRFSHT